MIDESFLVVGITVKPDRSQCNLISINGIENINCMGWETAADIHIKSEELADRLCDTRKLPMVRMKISMKIPSFIHFNS